MLNIAFVLLNHLLLFVSYFLSPFKGKVQKDLPSINNSKLWDFVAFKLVLFLLPSIQIYGSFENEHHHNPGNYENQITQPGKWGRFYFTGENRPSENRPK